MPLPFQGMMGRTLAQALLRQQERKNAEKAASQVYKGKFQSSGKYLFVAHPNCCEKCKLLGQTPHFFNTPDVAFITHPNCLCATIEAPAGLSPAQLMEWAQSPFGQLRFGFNYGMALRPLNVTPENRESQYKLWHDRMDPIQRSAHKRRLVRAKVTQEQVDSIRSKVKNGELGPAKDYTKRIEGLVKSAETRALGKKKPTEHERPKVTPKKKHQIEASQKRIKIKFGTATKSSTPKRRYSLKKGTTWNPNSTTRRLNRAETDTTVLPRNNVGITTEKEKLNAGGQTFVMGSAARRMARRRLADEQKKRREREKELRRRGFI